MGWAIWLAIPVAVTVLVGCWTWLRSRPKSAPTTRQAMRAHRDYLDALDPAARPARVTTRSGDDVDASGPAA